MYPVDVGEALDGVSHDASRSVGIDVLHRVDPHAGFAQQALLFYIHGAQADNHDIIGSDACSLAADPDEVGVAASRESRQGHAVDVARRRGRRRVEIRVGINPDHTRPQPRSGAGDPGDGPDRDGVIPPEEDREKTLLDYVGGPVADLFTDALYGGELLDLFPRRDSLGDGHTRV